MQPVKSSLMRNVHIRHLLLQFHKCGSCANFDSYLVLNGLAAGDPFSLKEYSALLNILRYPELLPYTFTAFEFLNYV